MIAIPIVLVMYFFLLPARFEGERYAPGKVEKGTVLALSGLISLGIFMMMIGIGDYRGGGISWMVFVPGLIVTYVLLVPVRMILRVKVHPFETSIVVSIILVALLIWVILPALAS